MLNDVNAMKVRALQVIAEAEAQKLNEPQNVISKETEEELSRKYGYTPLDLEVEKAMYMLQSYPCLRYNIESYIPILKRKVIGQDKTLEKLVYIAYYNQYVNFLEEFTECSNYNRKSMLLIAPTGCGKSTMLRALEKAFDVPVYRANITATTSAGYIGDKVESMLLGLIKKANGNIAAAERGILFIDEIDKKITSSTKERDVAGKAVQQELLKFFDKGTINLAHLDKTNPKGNVEFNTGKLTIILAGACVGLDDIRKERLRSKRSIGFSIDEKEEEKVKEYTDVDLIEYGFIPELIGRIDMIQELEPYTTSKLIDIIYFSDESSMQEHVRVLESLGVDNIMIDGALWEKIAEKILESALGIRKLNHIIGNLFYPVIFEAFKHTTSGECIIEADGSYMLSYEDDYEIYSGKVDLDLKEDEEF